MSASELAPGATFGAYRIEALLGEGAMGSVYLAHHDSSGDGEPVALKVIKAELAAQHPYDEWLASDQVRLDELPARTMLTPQHGRVVTQQRLFGYTTEEMRIILAPMARSGGEPIGSMGSDTSIAVLSDRSRLLYDYFTQLFAQVTNPPLDAIREELVTSLSASEIMPRLTCTAVTTSSRRPSMILTIRSR